MNIGRLRHRIVFQKDEDGTQDAYGQPRDGWQTYARRWAAITPQDGSETVEGGRPRAQVRHGVTCRYVRDVHPGHRIKFRQRTFEIKGILNLQERSRELRVECVEVIGPE